MIGNNGTCEQGLPQLVLDIAKALVDSPDQVKVNPVVGEQVTILEVSCAPDDVGKIIGRKGRTVRSIRTIVGAVSMKERRRYSVEVLERAA
ncbi:MAG: KH domain-containing protein [Candidatus Doudnabacteria bacterium]|nr:KH domain-containing protein [Candidatus Doudnabacteria bacterium]